MDIDFEISRWYNEDCTIGRLKAGKFQCFTLELRDLDNQTSISCIPDGEYGYYTRVSGRNGLVLELRNVPDRTYIQIHSGNYTSDILGCILVGDAVKWLNRDSIPDVVNSKNTLRELMSNIPETGMLRITG